MTNSRETALADLLDIVRRAAAGQVPAAILAPEAEDASERVLAAVPEPQLDPKAAHVLGLYHWLRFQALPEGPDQAALAVAEHYLIPVYLIDPEAVPAPLRRAFDQQIPGGGAAGGEALALSLLDAYGRTGQLELLVQATSMFRAALGAVPPGDPDRGGYLSNLCGVLQVLFARTGNLRVLREAVDVGRAAVAALPQGHPEYGGSLSNLGGTLQQLFEQTGEISVLLEAVEVGRAAAVAIPAASADRPACLGSLGNALETLYRQTGDIALLTEAVDAARAAAAATPEDHPDHAARRNALGVALSMLHERTGDLSVLLESVAASRAAVAATPVGHPDRGGYFNNLSVELLRMFQRTGELDALKEAVEAAGEAVGGVTGDDGARATCLSALAGALSALYERTDERSLLSEAVAAARAAVALTPEGHADRARWLSNLSTALRTLFGRTGELDLLVEAVETGRAAVAATPEHPPDRSGCQGGLAVSLLQLYRTTEDVTALAEAADTARAAVAATPRDHPEHAGLLSNLGIVLRLLSERTNDAAAMQEAVKAAREALSATPESHFEYAGRLNNLGGTLVRAAERTGSRTDLTEAERCYRRVALDDAATPFYRINARQALALLAADTGDADEELRCMEAAVELIDAFAPGALARADREHQIGRLSGIPGQAVAAALRAGRPERAVELLERTRGILAADRLGLTGEDQLRLQQRHPESARRLLDARARLDAHDSPRPERLEAFQRWQDALQEIRALAGFAGFFRSEPISTLARCARGGPVVFVVAGTARSDALILTDSAQPVRVVPLPRLTRASVYKHARGLIAATRTAGAPEADPFVRQGAQQEILAILAWLWDAIAEPVLAHLGHTAAPGPDGPWPRIWWCPVGILAFLPLHAAGHFGSADSGSGPAAAPRNVPGLVVSSYTLTARALARARALRPSAAASATLVVPVADLPGAELAGVAVETAAIAGLVHDATVLRHPTSAAVRAALPVHGVAHFSCHGRADWAEPSESCLVLDDYAESPLTVAEIAALGVTADLAFLSACDTAVSAPRLSDESVHITGAFHLAGYRGVVGTLWPVDDRAAASIAEHFYRRLTAEGTEPPHPERSAYALHHAAEVMRSQSPAAPSLWAAHIHTGL